MEYKFTSEVQMNYEHSKKKLISCISGVNGQDGSFLAEILLEKGYEVHGILRRSSVSNTKNIDHIKNNIYLHVGDVNDSNFINTILYDIQPNEFYHLAAQSHVGLSFDIPIYTAETVAIGTLNVLESVRKYSPFTKIYYAGTSELYGSAKPPQNENTLMHPNSPYSISKLFGFEMSRLYRKSYNLFISCGILFNHESERRGDEFVTQKIVKGLINCKLGKQKKLYLGNLDAKRDWGYARDYCEAMWMMLQHGEADDFVIGTGESYSIRDFLNVTGDYVKIDWKDYVEIDSNLFRPTETEYLLAAPGKAFSKLGWRPKVRFEQLVRIMVDAQINLEV
jgi:GDPmannose 4,6-dehydratase